MSLGFIDTSINQPSVIMRRSLIFLVLLFFALMWSTAQAHGVAGDDKAFLEQNQGRQLLIYMYLGAKHMVTGYDHLLFLFGVIFYLFRMREIGVYVTLFAIGHSVTLLFGVLSDTHVNPYIVDAIIGFSVVYKALDNLDGFKTLFGWQPNTKAAVLIFGFFTALAWQQNCKTLNYPVTAWYLIFLRLMSALKSANYLP